MAARAMIVLPLVLASLAGTGLPAPLSAQDTVFQYGRRPLIVLGRRHPGHITGVEDGGITVDLKDGGTQLVQFGEIWRMRRAFVSDEPAGTTVIDFANNRLFVATPLASVVDDAGKKIPLVKFTAPNGEIVYMAAGKVTDISASLPGLHNPLSKAVIGTRDGTQQVLEPADAARRIVAGARAIQ